MSDGLKAILYIFLFLGVLGLLALPYIRAQMETIYLANAPGFRQQIEHSAESIDLTSSLDQAEECDRFYWLQNTSPDPENETPPSFLEPSLLEQIGARSRKRVHDPLLRRQFHSRGRAKLAEGGEGRNLRDLTS